MTLDELMADIDARFECVIGIPRSISNTGEPYYEIGSRCVDRVLCPTEESCYSVLHRSILDYAEGKKGILYWRVSPECESAKYRSGLDSEEWTQTLWRGYARLLISDLPALEDENARREIYSKIQSARTDIEWLGFDENGYESYRMKEGAI